MFLHLGLRPTGLKLHPHFIDLSMPPSIRAGCVSPYSLTRPAGEETACIIPGYIRPYPPLFFPFQWLWA